MPEERKPSPVLAFLERELGPIRWVPPAAVIERVERARRRQVSLSLGLVAGMVISIIGAVVTAGATSYEIPAMFSLLSLLLFIGAAWQLRAARRAPPFPFAVFEDGVFVPATFENIPGLQKVGPARAIRKSKIKRVEDVRRGGERAILLWTKAGTGGVASLKAGEGELTPEERESALDSFVAALKAIGAPFADAAGTAPDAPSRDEAAAADEP